jgi:hypothetical protein
MRIRTASPLTSLLAIVCALAEPQHVDETNPYNGPAIPVCDLVDTTIEGDGTKLIRLVGALAVKLASANATNSINVIALAYVLNKDNYGFTKLTVVSSRPCQIHLYQG